MDSLRDRIKTQRENLHLSQEYVAKYLGINRSSLSQIENGKREVSANELSKLSLLFGVSSDTLLHGTDFSCPAVVFARSFEKLSDIDQAEIINLIRFKEKFKNKR